MSFKSGFESRERERESQFNAAGGSEFQVRGAAVPNVSRGIPKRQGKSRSENKKKVGGEEGEVVGFV